MCPCILYLIKQVNKTVVLFLLLNWTKCLFPQDISHKGKDKEKGKSPNLVSNCWTVEDFC
jgi:hypothetical protein